MFTSNTQSDMDSNGTHTQSSTQRRSNVPEQYEFEACVAHITVLGNLLKSIAFTPKVNVLAFSHGIRFTVEEGKYVQASVTVKRDIFDEFSLSSEDSEVLFKIPFKELLDCLKFFGSDYTKTDTSATTTSPLKIPVPTSRASLRLRYRSFGYPLQLFLDESGVTTDFEIKTEPFEEDLINFELDGGTVLCKLILGSEFMSDLLGEFESNSPGSIKIRIIPQTEMILSCEGIAGMMTATVPYDSTMIQLFESRSELNVSYKFTTLRSSFRAMTLSQTMSLKIDSNGVLSLTFLLPTKTDSFVEFFILPNATMDQEESGFPLG